jgi:peptide deformylase
MALLTIRIVPDPFLRKRAREIRIVDAGIRKLARDMIETLQDASGVGLAANQVGVLKRLIVLQMPGEEPRIMVNPEITYREGERQIDEGCLSVPQYIGLVTRSIKIKARALDESGGKLRLTAELLLAQAIEHEVDHLNGVLFLDHLVAHEQLRKVESPPRAGESGESKAAPAASPAIDPSKPHLHDVSLEVVVDHGRDARRVASVLRQAQDGSGSLREEVLEARAKLAGLTSDASPGDLSFELSARAPSHEEHGAGPPRGRRRVKSRDPALDGGVLLNRSPAPARPRSSRSSKADPGR